MPWSIPSLMSQRDEFIRALLHRRVPIRTLCQQFGLSEKTGYKWLARYEAHGVEGLRDRSHAPHVAAHQVPRPLVDALCALREAHPTWGPKKLRAVLAAAQPARCWPAPSTITRVLQREGVPLRPRRTAPERGAWASGLTTPTAPNTVWAADFKGEFRLRSGPYCYPLTVSDLQSRYVLGCSALPSVATPSARALFEQHFRAYGLPQVLRTDNGVPFGVPSGLGGLSTLALWWIRLGIRPERIPPGRPQHNGVHERMHRTLKAEATRPAAATFAEQQRRFTAWQRTFNTERPHEALGQTPPAQHYTPSPRPYPRRLPPLDYPLHYELRRVDAGGSIRWRGERVFLSELLAHEDVGLTPTSADRWTLYFGPLQLGHYHLEAMVFREDVCWTPVPA